MWEPLKRFVTWLLQVDLEPPAPPAGRSTRVFQASPAFLTYRLIPFWFGVAFQVIGATGGVLALHAAAHHQASKTGRGGMQAVVWHPATIVIEVLGFASLVAASAVHYGTIRLDYELRHYIVTDRSIRIREGALHVREMTLTHANVQNLRIAQGPLQRWLGISDLVIDTAGGGSGGAPQGGEGGAALGHHAAFTGIEDAEAICELIREHQRRSADAGLGDEARRGRAIAAVARARGGAGWTPALLDALRECKDAASRLRAAAEVAPPIETRGGPPGAEAPGGPPA